MPTLKNKLQWPDFNFQAMYCIHDSSFGLGCRHTHEDYYELVVVRSGSAMHCVENQSARIQAGDAFILSPGQTHHYLCNGELGIYNILFSEDFIRHILNVFPSDPALEDLLFFNRARFKALRIKRLKQDDFLQTISLVEEILVEQGKGAPRAKIAIAANFVKLLLLLSEEGKGAGELVGYEGDSAFRIACLLRALNARFAEKWTLAKMAFVCGMSASRFRFRFKEIAGQPPVAWLLRHRLYRAAQMLISSELDVSEIAVACGFLDSNYFIRQFHRVFGVAPLQFRKNPRRVWPLVSEQQASPVLSLYRNRLQRKARRCAKR